MKEAPCSDCGFRLGYHHPKCPKHVPVKTAKTGDLSKPTRAGYLKK